MRLTPSDPDVETLVGRVDSEELDLQPDFQRGEVWSLAKKQRLIDSILRDWHVPPVHLIVDRESQRAAVLDGQQRLAAIRDFKRNRFLIDGNIQPFNAEIRNLHGLTFDALPREWKARFNQFTIRVFRITDYEPSEPAELFFRLNQPTALTSAEKRNAFFGTTRHQVRELVALMEQMSLEKGFWGFSTARMAYDDIIARTCLTLENRSLRKKITAGVLADRYRAGTPFRSDVIGDLRRTIQILGEAKGSLRQELRFNKATAQTCLIFSCQFVRQVDATKDAPSHLGGFLAGLARLQESGWLSIDSEFQWFYEEFPAPTADLLLRVYSDRATSRVADTASVVLRDFVVWCAFSAHEKRAGGIGHFQELERLRLLKKELSAAQSTNELETFVTESGWDLP